MSERPRITRRSLATFATIGAIAAGSGVALGAESNDGPASSTGENVQLISGLKAPSHFKADGKYWHVTYPANTANLPDNEMPPPGLVVNEAEQVQGIQYESQNPAEVAQETLQVLNSGAIPNQVFNGKIELRSGVLINWAPTSLPIEGALKIKDGMTVELSYPRIARLDGMEWAISALPSASNEGQATDINRTVWVNLTKSIGSYTEALNQGERLLPVQVDAKGNLQAQGHASAELATIAEKSS